VALIAVVAAAGWLWWRSPVNPIMRRVQPAATASGSEPSQPAAPPSETLLAPIQLSPQRMQSIGVKVGVVESKTINDEIRLYGNVQPSERRFAYVQTRFAGWIRQVYADATGDFIRKGTTIVHDL
jgi:Cu(I)/Ag(I) efflux system membrane fusion protein/cobalt-zinc-cadmium efflux system membrane fusion protein